MAQKAHMCLFAAHVYQPTIQVSENLQFRNYGVRFGEGDVIGCYLDLNTDQVTIKVIVIVILFVPL